jgi:hypothetical protein
MVSVRLANKYGTSAGASQRLLERPHACGWYVHHMGAGLLAAGKTDAACFDTGSSPSHRDLLP